MQAKLKTYTLPLIAALFVIGITIQARGQDAAFANQRMNQLRGNFQRLDSNSDKIIELEEIRKDRERSFKIIDKNKDRKIIEGEFMAYQSGYYAKNLTQKQFDRLRRAYYRLDQDHGGSVTKEEFVSKSRIYFSQLDADGDGKVGWKEFSQPRNPLDRAKKLR